MLTRNESELLAVNMDNMHAFTVRLHGIGATTRSLPCGYYPQTSSLIQC